MRCCGTWSAYVGGCRCPECRDAAARTKHRMRHGSGPHPHICWFCPRTFVTANGASVHMGKVHSLPKHGTAARYQFGCRCHKCHRLRLDSGPHPHICWFCPRTFVTAKGASVHMGKVH